MTPSRPEAEPPSPPGHREPWLLRLQRPVDAAWLVWVRAVTGLILTWEMYRYLSKGWVERYYIEPDFNFTYFGFDWIRPWPEPWIYTHFQVVGVLGAMVAVGLLYRATSVLLFVGFSYIFLLDQAQYLNHLYLVCLLLFLFIFLPANRLASLDVRLGLARRSEEVPAWALWLLRAQVGMVYFWGGVAKLNADWLRARPMLDWMEDRRDLPLLGPLLAWDPTAWAMSYGGVLLDLFIVPLLLWRRTRILALVLAFGFHAMNNFIFSIGIFPYLMSALTLIFCEPGWPRRAFPRLFPPRQPPVSSEPRPLTAWGRLGYAGIAAWLLLQVALPLRHWVYPGEVSWTEEGHLFAWHMKLRSKSARAAFRVRDADTGKEWAIKPEHLLSERQVRKMKTRPDMILQFCHHIEDEMRRRGHREVEVYADVTASLNGRPYQPLVDPGVDLTAQRRELWPPASWIVPLPHGLPLLEVDASEDGD